MYLCKNLLSAIAVEWNIVIGTKRSRRGAVKKLRLMTCATATAGVDVVEEQRGTSVRPGRRREKGGRSCVLIHATRHLCGSDLAYILGLRNLVQRTRARNTTAAESARNAYVARRFPIYASLAGLRSVSCTAIDCAAKGGESHVGGSARVGGAGGGADRGKRAEQSSERGYARARTDGAKRERRRDDRRKRVQEGLGRKRAVRDRRAQEPGKI